MKFVKEQYISVFQFVSGKLKSPTTTELSFANSMR